jgi:sialidase-1
MTRRALLPCAAMAARLAKAAPRARVESLQVISQQPEFYHGWPTLTRLHGGELLVTYSGGREAHVCPFGRVEIIRSSDNGRSWSWPETVLDTPIDDRDSGVCETPAGSLLVTTFTSLAYEDALKKANGWDPQRLAHWRAVNLRAPAERRKEMLGTWMLRSTDGGMTWSTLYRVPVNSPHGPVAASGGRLLYAGKKLWDSGRKVGFCESTDDGVSWRWLSDIPARAGDTAAEYHELHAVEAGDGRIIVQIRNHNTANAGETLQCESADGGHSWTSPRPTGVWGMPSHLVRLRDDRLLMTYGYRRAPFGNLARISEDHGRTWSAPLVISNDGAGSDLGYPSTVELPNGEFVTVWYERPKDSPRAVLRKAQWSIV